MFRRVLPRWAHATALGLLLLLAGRAWSADPATFEWQGSAGGSWTDPARWTITAGTDGDGIPDADDTVIVTAAVDQPDAVGLRIDGHQACASLTINAGQALPELTFTFRVTSTDPANASLSIGDGMLRLGCLQTIQWDVGLRSPANTMVIEGPGPVASAQEGPCLTGPLTSGGWSTLTSLTLRQAQLAFACETPLADAVDLTVESTAVLRLFAGSYPAGLLRCGRLLGDGKVTFYSTGGSTLSVGNGDVGGTITAVIGRSGGIDLLGRDLGPIGVYKVGTGTITLAGTGCDFYGSNSPERSAINVMAGTLVLAQAIQAGSSAMRRIDVAAGATLRFSTAGSIPALQSGGINLAAGSRLEIAADSVAADRIPDATPCNSSGGTIRLDAQADTSRSETIGALALAPGRTVVELNPSGAGDAVLTLASVAANGGTLEYHPGTSGGAGVARLMVAAGLSDGQLLPWCTVHQGATVRMGQYSAANGIVAAAAGVIVSNASGSWDDPATWIGGVVPGIGDTAHIQLDHVVTVSAAGPAVPAAGLEAHWPLDEGAGPTAADGSGFGRDATLVGPAWSGSPYQGASALDFTAANHYADAGTWDPPDTMSISCWVYYRGDPGHNEGIVCKSQGWAAGTMRWHFGRDKNADKLAFSRAGGSNYVQFAYDLPVGRWTHLLVTHAADGTAALWVDGIQASYTGDQNMTYGDDGTAPVLIGNSTAGGSESFNGIIDDVRIYSQVLDATQIAVLSDARGSLVRGLLLSGTARLTGAGQLTLVGGDGLQVAPAADARIECPLGAGGKRLQVRVGGAATLTLAGELNGRGGVTKDGSGSLAIAGAAAWSGGLTIDEGLVLLGGGAQTWSGSTSINADGILRLTADEVLPDQGDVNLYDNGILDLANHDETVGNLFGHGGSAKSARVFFGDGSPNTLRVGANNGSTTADQMYAAICSNDPDDLLEKIGTGYWHVRGGIATASPWPNLRVTANQFRARLLLSAGSMRIVDAEFMGTGDPGDGGTTVAAGAQLILASNDADHLRYEALTLSGHGTDGTGALVTEGTCTWLGPITLVGDTGIKVPGGFESSSCLIVSGGITGVGDLTLRPNGGGGLLRMHSLGTYQGLTTVTSGVNLRILRNNQVGNGDRPVVVLPGAQLQPENTTTGSPCTITNPIYLGGTLSSRFAGSMADVLRPANVISGPVYLTGDATIDTIYSPLTITGTISGNHALTKASTGASSQDFTLTLAAANSFSSIAFAPAGGFLRVAHPGALGGTAALDVPDGCRLEFSGGINLGALPVTLNDSVLSSYGTLRNVDGDNSFAGPVTLAGAACSLGAEAGTLTLGGAVGDGGGARPITKLGAGTVALSAAATWSGTTTVQAGSLRLSGAGSIADSPTVAVAAGASLDLQGSPPGGAGFLKDDAAVQLTASSTDQARLSLSADAGACLETVGTLSIAGGPCVVALAAGAGGNAILTLADGVKGLTRASGGLAFTRSVAAGGTPILVSTNGYADPEAVTWATVDGFAAEHRGALGLVPVAGSSAKVSNGSGGGLWGDGSTWVGGVAPNPGDSVTIQASDTVTLTADVSVGGVAFAGTGSPQLAGAAWTMSLATATVTVPDGCSPTLGCRLAVGDLALTLEHPGAGTLTCSGPLLAPSTGLIKNGAGLLVLAHDHNVSGLGFVDGRLILNAGTARLGADFGLPASATVDIYEGATLDLANYDLTLADINDTGPSTYRPTSRILLGDGAPNVLSIGNSTPVDIGWGGVISGTDADDQIRKIGNCVYAVWATGYGDTYRADFHIDGGTVHILTGLQFNGVCGPLGNGLGTVHLHDGTVLRNWNNGNADERTLWNPISVESDPGNPAKFSLAGPKCYGLVTVQAGKALTVESTASYFYGGLGGSGAVNFTAATGDMNIYGAGGFSGILTANAAGRILKLYASTALGTGSLVVQAGTVQPQATVADLPGLALLDLQGGTFAPLGAFTLTGPFQVSASASTRTLGGASGQLVTINQGPTFVDGDGWGVGNDAILTCTAPALRFDGTVGAARPSGPGRILSNPGAGGVCALACENLATDGGVWVDSGTCWLLHADGIGADTAPLTLSGGTFASQAADPTILPHPLVLDASSTLGGTYGLTFEGNASTNASATLTCNAPTIFDNAGHSTLLTIAGGSTLTLAGSTPTITLASAIQATNGGLTYNPGAASTNRLLLSGDSNTWIGAVTVSSGVVAVSHANALGTAAAGTTVASGGALELSGGITIADAIALNGTGIASGGGLRSSAGDNTVSGNITLTLAGGNAIGVDAGSLTVNAVGQSAATRSLTKVGAGTLKLNGAGTWAGGLTISAGTVELLAADRIAETSTNTVNIANGATLDLGGFGENLARLTGSGAVVFGNGGANTLTIGTNITSGTSFSFDGTFSSTDDTDLLAKAATGTCTISAAQPAWAGLVAVNDGVLAIGDATALGPAGSAKTTVASGATLSLGALTVLNEPLELSGTGEVANTGALRCTAGPASWGGDLTLLAAATIGCDSGDLTVNNVNQSGGTFALTKAGAGRLLLNQASTGSSWQGGLTVAASGGDVVLGVADAIHDSNVVTLASGTRLDLNDKSETVAGISSAGTVRFGNGAVANTFTLNHAANLTFSGQLIEADATDTVAKAGAGTLTLSGDNSGYPGLFTVGEGCLSAGHANALGDTLRGTTVNGTGALGLAGGITITGEPLTIAPTGDNAAGHLQVTDATSCTWTDGLTVDAAAAVTIKLGAIANGTLNLPGTLTDSVQDLAKVGAGRVVLGGDNAASLTRLVTVSVGALQITHAGALGSAGAVGSGTETVVAATGAALELAGNLTVAAEGVSLTGTGIGTGGALRSVSGTSTWQGGVTLAASADIGVDAGSQLTLDTTALSGATALNKRGTGILVLDVDNSATFTSTITVVAGTLTVKRNGALGSTGAGTTVNPAGATLLLDGAIALGAEGLNIRGTGVDGNGALQIRNGDCSVTATLTQGAASTIGVDAGCTFTTGVIGGLFAFTKAGTGILDVTGTSLNNNSVTVNGGTLKLSGTNGRMASATGFTVNNGATLALVNNGVASPDKIGNTRTITLNASNLTLTAIGAAYTETITYLALNGACTVGFTADALGNAAMSCTGGTNGITQGVGATLAFTRTVGGANTPQLYTTNGYADDTLLPWATVDGSAAQYDRAPSNVGLVPAGASTTYSTTQDGNWNDAATWGGAGPPSLATDIVVINDTHDVIMNASQAVARCTIDGTGTLTAGGGTLTLSDLRLTGVGNASIACPITIGANELVVDHSGSGICTISSQVLESTPAGGKLTKRGTGTLALTNSNTFTGAVRVEAGTLQAGHNTALGTSAGGVTVLSGATLDVTGGVTVTSEALSIGGPGAGAAGALRSTAGANAWTGGVITLTNDITVDIADGASLLCTGTFGQATAYALTKTGTGTFGLSASSNTWTGAIAHNAGSIRATTSVNALGTTGTCTLADGATLELDTVASTGLVKPLNIRGTGVGGIAGAIRCINGAAYISSAITLAADATIKVVAPATSLQTNGAISGVGFKLTVANDAGLPLVVSAANTYTGGTQVDSGILRTDAANQFPNSGTITIAAGAVLDLNAQGDTIGNLAGAGDVLWDGTAPTDAAADTLTFGGDGTDVEFSGRFCNAAGQADALDVCTKTGTGTFTFSGTMGDFPGNFNANGGTVILSGNNAGYTGVITLNNANTVLRVAHANALGETGAATLVKNGTTLEVASGLAVAAEPLTMSSAAAGTAGILRFLGGTASWGAATMTLTQPGATIQVDGGTATLNGAFSGGQPVTKTGAGTLALAASSNPGFTSTCAVNVGSLRVEADGALGTNAATTVNAGATLILADGLVYDDVAEPVTINAGTLSCPGTATWSGTVSLGTVPALISFGDPSSLTLGALTFSTAGNTVAVPGNAALSITGNLTFTQAGEVTVASTGSLAVGAATVFTQAGAISVASGGSASLNTLTINNNATLTLAGTAALTVGGTTTFSTASKILSLTVPATATATWNGALTFTQAGTVSLADNGVLTLGGPITPTNDPTFTTGSAAILTLAGQVGNVNKTLTGNGTGTLILAGDNGATGGSFPGAISIGAGSILRVTHANGLGTTAAGTTIAAGAELRLSGGLAFAAETINASGTGLDGDGALRNLDGANTWNGTLSSADGEATIGIDGGSLVKGGNISASQVRIRKGTLTLGADEVLRSTNVLVLDAGTVLDCAGFSQAVDRCTGSGTLRLGNGSNLFLLLGSSSSTFDGLLDSGATATLDKLGSGSLTLTADSAACHGAVQVQAGTLVLGNGVGSATGDGPLRISLAGTLAGTGLTGSAVTVAAGGTVAPGLAGPGRLTVGAFTASAGAQLTLDLDGTVAATQHDQLRCTGAVDLGGLSLVLDSTQDFALTNALTVVDSTGGGAITGIFAGLTEAGYVEASPDWFQVSYLGGTGNDAVLTCVATPPIDLAFEPGDVQPETVWNLGAVALGSSHSSGDFTVRNVGWPRLTLAVQVVDPATWRVHTEVGATDRYLMEGDLNADATFETVLGTGSTGLVSPLARLADKVFRLRFTAPTAVSTVAEQTVRVRVVATYY